VNIYAVIAGILLAAGVALWYQNGKIENLSGELAVADQALVNATATLGVITNDRDQILAAFEREQERSSVMAEVMLQWLNSAQKAAQQMRENSEGANNLMSDDDWWCASERIPDIVINGMHMAQPTE